jgi:hypothetical protein
MSHDQLIHGGDRFRFELSQRVTNSAAAESRRFVPLTFAEQTPKCSMVLTQIRKLVVIQIAAEPHNCQHKHLPVSRSLAASIIVCGFIDIIGNELAQPISEIVLNDVMFQCFENRYNFVSAIQIQTELLDGLAIQSPRRLIRLSHRFVP